MSLQESKHIKELWYIDHRKDDLKNTGYDYKNNIFKRTLSNVMFGNPTTAEFLTYLQKQIVLMFESVLLVRNLYNWTVDKYYDKFNN